MSLSDFRTLGRSGLAVSPLTLGTMTFGTARWGLDTAGSKAVFDAYVEAGGNAVDTADVYSNGRSEEMLGSFIAERGLRDEIVLATKSGFATGQGPHAGGPQAMAMRGRRTTSVSMEPIRLATCSSPTGTGRSSMSSVTSPGRWTSPPPASLSPGWWSGPAYHRR